MRWIWIGIGWTAVAAAFVGVWLPLVPTVPFLLVALAAFARGSPQTRQWLFSHPHFGEMLHEWHHQGAIPRRGKILSIVGMTASYAVLLATTELPFWVLALVALTFVVVGIYVVSRPAPVRG